MSKKRKAAKPQISITEELEQAKAAIGTTEANCDRLVEENLDLRQKLEALRKLSDGNAENGAAWKKLAEQRETEAKELRDRVRDLTIQNAEMRGYIARVNEDEVVRFFEAHPPFEREVRQAPYRPFLDRFAPVKEEASWARH